MSAKVSLEVLSCGIKTEFGIKAWRADTFVANVILGITKLRHAMEK